MKDIFLFTLTSAVAAALVAGGLHLRAFEAEIRSEALRQTAVDDRLSEASLSSAADRECLASGLADLGRRVSKCERLLDKVFRERASSQVITVNPPVTTEDER